MNNRILHFEAIRAIARWRRGRKIRVILLNLLAAISSLSLAIVPMSMYPSSPAYSPPIVAISPPVSGTIFIAPADITIYASAIALGSTVAKVDFFENGEFLASVTSMPYSYKWSGVPEGQYVLTAAVTNSAGATTVSSPVKVFVRTQTGTGCTCDAGCESRTDISPPYTMDGPGQFCWETTSLGRFVFSWNLDTLEINGVDCANRWANSFPQPINGKYFIFYVSSAPSGHFEIR